MTEKQSTSIWIWIFLILMLLSFAAFILFLDQKVIKNGTDNVENGQADSSETKPTIDFYTVLPQRELEVLISEENMAGMENPTINKEVKGKVILQVGSFQSAADADSLKAQLAFLGLEAKVSSAKVKKDTWHRVLLGPYTNGTRLSQAKNQLIENRIEYMQREAQ
jgi:cell division protein FtsN